MSGKGLEGEATVSGGGAGDLALLVGGGLRGGATVN